MGHDVIVLDDLSGGFLDNVPKKAQFVKGSVADVELVKDLFKQNQIAYVFHLAAYAAEGLSHFIRCYNYHTNLIGSCNLINEAVNAGTVKCFVFTSSIAVYGEGQTPLVEEMQPRPEDPYGVSKYAVELDLEAARRMFGLNYVIFRPHNVYGERQNIADPYRNVIGIFMRQALQGEMMTLFGDGSQTRAFTHIDDVALAIATAAQRETAYNQVFNIGADKPYSVNELSECVARALGVECRRQYLPARNEVLHAFSDHAKLHRHFADCIRGVTLEEGLKRMANWVHTAPKYPIQRFSGIEIWKNMPPKWVSLTVKSDEKQA